MSCATITSPATSGELSEPEFSRILMHCLNPLRKNRCAGPNAGTAFLGLAGNWKWDPPRPRSGERGGRHNAV